MKRIIPLAFALVLLAGCAQKHYTPAVSTDFNISAVYSAGDFSCSCTVKMKNNAVTVTALSGKAKGTAITYDGKNTSFSLNGTMQKVISAAETPPKNPAKLLYTVFSSLKIAKILRLSIINITMSVRRRSALFCLFSVWKTTNMSRFI